MEKEILALKEENKRLKKEVERLKNITVIDFLTRLYNRRAFSNFLKTLQKDIKWVCYFFRTIM